MESFYEKDVETREEIKENVQSCFLDFLYEPFTDDVKYQITVNILGNLNEGFDIHLPFDLEFDVKSRSLVLTSWRRSALLIWEFLLKGLEYFVILSDEVREI